MLNIDKIYITHYLPLKQRKENILNNLKFEMKWEESEPEEIFWTEDEENWTKKCSEAPFRKLKKQEISLAYKHLQIYKDISKNRYEKSLIFEDDVLLLENFEKKFNLYLEKTPQDWDLIFIGNGCNLRINQSFLLKDKVAYKTCPPRTKCTDSYCIKLEAVNKILSTIVPISLPIDFELNYQMSIHNLNCYWWDPPLTTQGSQCGLYQSEIQI